MPLAQTDRAAVYAAVLASAYPASAERQVVVLSRIQAVKAGQFGSAFDADERWRDLLAEQGRVHDVAFAPSDPNVVLLTGPDWEQLFVGRGSEGWADFHARFPRAEGVVKLSAVGLDGASQSAVVLASIDREHSMSGKLYVVEKRGNQWVVTGAPFGVAGMA